MSQQPGPEMRIGDAEREAAVTALGEHFAAGRLTKEEYDERSSRAWDARTASALWPLFADLPRPQATRPRPPSSPGTGPSYSSGPRRDGGWVRAAALPVFLVLAGLLVLTHLPVILVVLVIVLVWAKLSGRHGARHRHAGHRHPGDRHWQS